MVLITLSYFSRHLNTMGELCLPLTDFIEWGRFFLGKGKRGEWGSRGGKNRKTGNMQCISTGLKGFCFANNVYIPCVGVKGIERVHAGIRLRLGNVFQFKQKPRWHSNIQPRLTLGPFSVVYW